MTTSPIGTTFDVPSLARPYIHYDSQYKVLVCVKCEEPHAVTRINLVRHWRKNYNMKKKEYQPILDCIAHLEAPAERIENLPQVPDGHSARPGLLVIKGFKCTFATCNFRTTGFLYMGKHTRKEHKIECRQEGTYGFAHVSLQTWQSSSGLGYWIVTDEKVDGENYLKEQEYQQGWKERVSQIEAIRQQKRHDGLDVLTQGQVE